MLHYMKRWQRYKINFFLRYFYVFRVIQSNLAYILSTLSKATEEETAVSVHTKPSSATNDNQLACYKTSICRERTQHDPNIPAQQKITIKDDLNLKVTDQHPCQFCLHDTHQSHLERENTPIRLGPTDKSVKHFLDQMIHVGGPAQSVTPGQVTLAGSLGRQSRP